MREKGRREKEEQGERGIDLGKVRPKGNFCFPFVSFRRLSLTLIYACVIFVLLKYGLLGCVVMIERGI